MPHPIIWEIHQRGESDFPWELNFFLLEVSIISCYLGGKCLLTPGRALQAPEADLSRRSKHLRVYFSLSSKGTCLPNQEVFGGKIASCWASFKNDVFT